MYNISLTSTGFHVSLSGVGAKGADGAGAYAHAVAGGYSGTELQFNTYLADLSASATAAANSAMGAAVSATSAEDSAESALTSAATAITKSDQASASAVAAATSATTASSASTAATASAVAALASQNSATLGASTATTQAVIATTQADLSKDWATKTSSEVVAGQGFGALKYASDAAASAATATTKASEASTSATNAASSETVAITKATAASISATNAASSETVATTKASVATTKASEASTSATNAASSETAATNAASTASTHAGTAVTAASTVSTHANKAQQWADAGLNVQVESGKYSAKHWAAQAQASVTGAIIYRGAFSATSGLYPAAPVLGDYYKISDTGTLGGIVHVTGDSIIYNGTTWDKIGSTDAVTSVAGRVGAVIVTKTDIDLANVDNTSDVNKPVSTATQTALNGKADLANPTFTGTVSGVTKGMVGLANVDNTSDAAKPVSTAQQTALNEKEPAIAVGTTAQYWRGDKTWRDFFTDVRAATLTGLSTATDAIITTADTVLSALGKLQKQISDNLTTLTSHTGNTSNPHGVTKAQVGLDNVDNTADSAKPVSTAQQTALDAKQAALVSGSNIKTVNGNSLLGGGDLSITAGISDAPSDGKTYGRKDAGWAETVTPADTQTLTNKTLTSPIFNDGYTEEVFAVTGTTPALSPTNGSIQTWVLSGNSTPTAGTWVSGQSMTLMVDDGSAYTINWASMSITWKTGGGTAPALLTTDYTPIELTKIGTTIYGWLAGDA